MLYCDVYTQRNDVSAKRIDKMMIGMYVYCWRTKQKGKIELPETVAYIANYVVEGAREGKSVAELMKSARSVLKMSDVMAGGP